MHITRLASALGARVDGMDVTGTLDAATVDSVDKALLDHEVLVVPAPGMTPDQHLAPGRALGDVEVHASFPNLGPGNEPVSVLDSAEGNQDRRP